MSILVFIQTNSPVDLSYLEGSAGRGSSGSSTLSELEQLADSISTGAPRTIGAESTSAGIRYQVSARKFTLGLRPPVQGTELPAPEAIGEGKGPQERGGACKLHNNLVRIYYVLGTIWPSWASYQGDRSLYLCGKPAFGGDHRRGIAVRPQSDIQWYRTARFSLRRRHQSVFLRKSCPRIRS
jgi:hypothetical protein